eukprot:CAMPEP_0203809728 /NCGR_PEP_ID=MMETSP0115-20131106/2489_1 /ASSEMBLY_ACC=CAM_ASM_000227 /TAXON_ID=33651 /ORGANISM="Bicosoecid sp, Strain ms1" /LENGTH=32 /DNA_ID= /DNA_START= /DNA_END= /DNA_ORIENTATION=
MAGHSGVAAARAATGHSGAAAKGASDAAGAAG